VLLNSQKPLVFIPNRFEVFLIAITKILLCKKKDNDLSQKPGW